MSVLSLRGNLKRKQKKKLLSEQFSIQPKHLHPKAPEAKYRGGSDPA